MHRLEQGQNATCCIAIAYQQVEKTSKVATLAQIAVKNATTALPRMAFWLSTDQYKLVVAARCSPLRDGHDDLRRWSCRGCAEMVWEGRAREDWVEVLWAFAPQSAEPSGFRKQAKPGTLRSRCCGIVRLWAGRLSNDAAKLRACWRGLDEQSWVH